MTHDPCAIPLALYADPRTLPVRGESMTGLETILLAVGAGSSVVCWLALASAYHYAKKEIKAWVAVVDAQVQLVCTLRARVDYLTGECKEATGLINSGTELIETLHAEVDHLRRINSVMKWDNRGVSLATQPDVTLDDSKPEEDPEVTAPMRNPHWSDRTHN